MKTSRKSFQGISLKTAKTPHQFQKQIMKISEQQFALWSNFKDREEQINQYDIVSGEIWSTLSKLKYPRRTQEVTNHPYLVLILDADNEPLEFKGKEFKKILVVPISTNIEMATQWDIVINDQDSPLGYPIMLELWNKVTMLEINLNRGLAKLDHTTLDHVKNFNSALIDNWIDDIEIDYKQFEKQIGNGVVKPGNEIYHFQRKEIENVEYLSFPLKHLVEGISARSSKIIDSIRESLPYSKQVPIDITEEDNDITNSYGFTEYSNYLSGVSNV